MKKIAFLVPMIFFYLFSFANNATISNISIVGSAGNFRVKFDFSWDNAWKVTTGQNNYDGIYVFFKYRTNAGNWQHLNLNGNNNSVPSPFAIYQNSGVNKTGAILHLSSTSAGLVTGVGAELGISTPPFDVDVAGFVIEMVYIPQCDNCIIGDGDGSTESLNALHVIDNTSGALGNTFKVDSPANSFDDATLKAGISINSAGISGNANFPTGQAVWVMKHELSQAGYKDFLNFLPLSQQGARIVNTGVVSLALVSNLPSHRNFIEVVAQTNGQTPFVFGLDANNNNVYNEAGDGEWIACNYLSWPDVAAYLDWSGLAPMTEIIYERICRGASTIGVNPSAMGELAWGSQVYNGDVLVLSSPLTEYENVTNLSAISGNANTVQSTVGGPLRPGNFSLPTSNRLTAGSSFYGVTDMTGNLSEICVTVGNVAGRSFSGENGDGVIDNNGNANVSSWPCSNTASVAASCAAVTGNAGLVAKGGAWDESFVPVSSRIESFFPFPSGKSDKLGCRGALYIH